MYAGLDIVSRNVTFLPCPLLLDMRVMSNCINTKRGYLWKNSGCVHSAYSFHVSIIVFTCIY